MLAPVLKKNDKNARILILTVSIIVFVAVVILGRVKVEADLGFNVHIFATINAGINSAVAVLLIAALVAVRQKKYLLHKRIMVTAIILSIFFLLSYICHHLFAGETKFGDVNHDGLISANELSAISSTRMIYYFILGTHIVLAAIILPFILFTAYRALTGQWHRHRKLARITWPIWLYVALTGPIVYLMISPYY